jgi:hypothetical protein
MSKPPDVAGALAAMRSVTRGPRNRSPIYGWLEARYDALAEAFKSEPPKWKALAKYLGDGGVLNSDGERPSPAAVRSSWTRLEADVARKRKSQPARSRPQPAPPIPRAEPRDEVPTEFTHTPVKIRT